MFAYQVGLGGIPVLVNYYVQTLLLDITKISIPVYRLFDIIAQVTVRSKAPHSGYIAYTMGNTSIFQEVTSSQPIILKRTYNSRSNNGDNK